MKHARATCLPRKKGVLKELGPGPRGFPQDQLFVPSRFLTVRGLGEFLGLALSILFVTAIVIITLGRIILLFLLFRHCPSRWWFRTPCRLRPPPSGVAHASPRRPGTTRRGPRAFGESRGGGKGEKEVRNDATDVAAISVLAPETFITSTQR